MRKTKTHRQTERLDDVAAAIAQLNDKLTKMDRKLDRILAEAEAAHICAATDFDLRALHSDKRLD
jgi:prefoldin subunit 5